MNKKYVRCIYCQSTNLVIKEKCKVHKDYVKLFCMNPDCLKWMMTTKEQIREFILEDKKNADLKDWINKNV